MILTGAEITVLCRVLTGIGMSSAVVDVARYVGTFDVNMHRSAAGAIVRALDADAEFYADVEEYEKAAAARRIAERIAPSTEVPA